MTAITLATYSPLRTGRRTFGGLLKDGFNSAVRYYYNNFNDGYRQVILTHVHIHMCTNPKRLPKQYNTGSPDHSAEP